MIHVSPADRRALRVPWRALLANKSAELATKALGRRIKGQGMIGADAAAVATGFAALQDADFHHYNLPQAWVEARQIPLAIHGRIPATHAAVIDLGCGPGTSTAILAHFAHPTWRITGYDLTPAYIKTANARAAAGRFHNRRGERIDPAFICQDVSRPFRTLTPASIDFALSGGVVGLYLRPDAVARLAAELTRVIKPRGYAALDAGPSCPPRMLRAILEAAGFTLIRRVKSFWIEPRPKLVFQRV